MLPANYGQCGCQTVKKGPNYGASKVADILTSIQSSSGKLDQTLDESVQTQKQLQTFIQIAGFATLAVGGAAILYLLKKTKGK